MNTEQQLEKALDELHQLTSLKSVLQDLYEFSQATDIKTDGKPITLADYQTLLYPFIDQLADLLGIELEG